MRHVTHMNASCHTYEWVMSHTWMVHVTHKWCHITRMDESCHTYDSFMLHIWMSYVTYMNESCHTCEWVTSHARMSHVTHEWVTSHMNESRHIWMSHVTHMNVARQMYEWVTSHMNLRHDNNGCAICQNCRFSWVFKTWPVHLTHLWYMHTRAHIMNMITNTRILCILR